ncbi:MAG TPA: hypothetical protein VF452_24140 [Candidatus Binatia bacterium]
MVTYENGGKEGKDSPILFYVDEARAWSARARSIGLWTFPPVDKVIGPYEQIKVFPFPGAAPVAARGALSLEARDVMIGGADIWGQANWRCAEF